MRFWTPRQLKAQPLVTIQVAAFPAEQTRLWAALRCLVASYQAQTYENWEMLVTHDGPLRHKEQGAATLALLKQDPRIRWLETNEREGQFGHKWRRNIVLRHGRGEVVGFTNADNIYMPVYLEWLLSEMENTRADFAFCDMIHSHQHWRLFSTEPRYKKLDLGGFLVSRRLVKATPWTDTTFSGDGAYINALVAKSRKAVKVKAVLFVHN